MLRTFNLGLIEQRLERLYRIANSDRCFDMVIARRDETGGAAPHPELAYSGFSAGDLQSIAARGLLCGLALGRGGGQNASFIWFKRGEPFYVDSPTLVIQAERLEALGGYDSVGLAGQKDVMRMPYEQAPDGIPLREFAIVYCLAGGWVIPVYKPPGWLGATGDEVAFSDFR